MGTYVYIVECRDRSYYSGTTRATLEQRIGQHNSGAYGGYTKSRRPVKLVYAQYFDRIVDAIAAERQIKGWRREKKMALIEGDFTRLPILSKSYRKKEEPQPFDRIDRLTLRDGPAGPPQGEEQTLNQPSW